MTALILKAPDEIDGKGASLWVMRSEAVRLVRLGEELSVYLSSVFPFF